jgi:hypothetical protein
VLRLNQRVISKNNIGLLTYKQPDEFYVFVIESGQFRRFQIFFFDHGVGVTVAIDVMVGNGVVPVHGVALTAEVGNGIEVGLAPNVGGGNGVGLPTYGVGLDGLSHGVGLAVAVDGVGLKYDVGLATKVPGNGVRVAGTYAVGVEVR